jgi:hypothetical protein
MDTKTVDIVLPYDDNQVVIYFMSATNFPVDIARIRFYISVTEWGGVNGVFLPAILKTFILLYFPYADFSFDWASFNHYRHFFLYHYLTTVLIPFYTQQK